MEAKEIIETLHGLIEAMQNIVEGLIDKKIKLDALHEEIRSRKHDFYLDVKEIKDDNDKPRFSNETMRDGEVMRRLKETGIIKRVSELENEIAALDSKIKVITKKIEIYKSILAYKTAEISARNIESLK